MKSRGHPGFLLLNERKTNPPFSFVLCEAREVCYTTHGTLFEMEGIGE